MQETNRVIATSNTVIEGSDDSFDFHSSDDTGTEQPVRTGIIVSNNYLEKTEGVVCLGAKLTVVTNNTFKLCQGNTILVGGGVTPEGGTSPYGIIVSNNTVTDPIEALVAGSSTLPTSTAGQGAISVAGFNFANGDTSANSVIPGNYNSTTGAFSYPFDNSGTTPTWGAMNTGSRDTLSTAKGYNFVITNNSVLRTLPDVLQYSDFGYGEYFSGADGYVNPAVALQNYRDNAIILFADMENFVCSNNVISGLPNAGIYLRAAISDNRQSAFKNGIIGGNVITNMKYGVAKDFIGNGVAFADYDDWTILIHDNVIDIDPYHKADIRTQPLNGTWQSSANQTYIGLLVKNCKSMTIRANVFSNCYRPIQANNSNTGVVDDSSHTIVGNIVNCGPVAVDWNAANTGVGVPNYGGDLFKHNIYDCNPTSANYNELLNTCVLQSTVVPTTGTFVTGHFVRNSTPTTTGSKTTLGWARQTVGSGHSVAGATTADWAPIVATTS
jgi:hypothetical protein